MRRNPMPRIPVNVQMEPSLHEEVQILLHDPLTGRVKYGALSDLANRLFRQWVDAQRADTLDLE